MTVESGQATRTESAAIPADTFAHRLMLARAHAGHISIREAADRCGLGRGAWTNWERGARAVDIIEVASVISEQLGVDRDWLLFGGPLATPEAGSGRNAARRRDNVRSADLPVRVTRRRTTRTGALLRRRPSTGPAARTEPNTGPSPVRPRFTRIPALAA